MVRSVRYKARNLQTFRGEELNAATRLASSWSLVPGLGLAIS